MKLIEGIDYYWDGSKMIFTREFLLSRGFCCNSKCKNCPYKENEQESNQKGNANSDS